MEEDGRHRIGGHEIEARKPNTYMGLRGLEVNIEARHFVEQKLGGKKKDRRTNWSG